MEGDDAEFGAFEGASLIKAYRTLERVRAEHQRVHAGRSPADARAIGELWQRMRFIGFGSFQWLPPVEGIDAGTPGFKEGGYRSSEDRVRRNVRQAYVPDERVLTVPGWFRDTCTPETISRLGLQRAAIVPMDCNLYASSKDALECVKPLLVDGTVLVFDDWHCFRNRPELGERRAFAEYQKEGP